MSCSVSFVQKTLRECAANMGSKISLLVYEWPLIKCKIWYMNGSIFQNLSQNWLKFKKILEKIGNFVQNFAYEWQFGIWMGYFFLENWYLYGSTFKFFPLKYENPMIIPSFACFSTKLSWNCTFWLIVVGETFFFSRLR